MNNLDEQIRDALQAEQGDLADDDDWLAHYESLNAMFRGQQRWITIYQCALSGVVLTMMVICAIQFFRVESMRAMIAWATGFTWCLIGGAIIELWFLMEWTKCVIRREIKQLELQVASLANAMRTQGDQRES